MKIKCESCHKIFNFKTETLPDKAFSFKCTKCDEKVWVAEEELADAKIEARKKSKTETAGNERRISMPKVDPVKLKKPVMKLVGLVSRISGRPEHEWLFSLTKFAAIFSIAALIVLIALGGFTLFSVIRTTEVTYTDVERSLYLKKDPTLSIDAAVPGIKLPDRVKKYLGTDYRETFVEWMNGLDDRQKVDFVDNLDRIIKQAQNRDPNNIYDYINEYKSLKYNRSVTRPFVQYLFKIGIAVALIAMITLLGLFCLVLLQISWQKKLYEL